MAKDAEGRPKRDYEPLHMVSKFLWPLAPALCIIMVTYNLLHLALANNKYILREVNKISLCNVLGNYVSGETL